MVLEAKNSLSTCILCILSDSIMTFGISPFENFFFFTFTQKPTHCIICTYVQACQAFLLTMPVGPSGCSLSCLILYMPTLDSGLANFLQVNFSQQRVDQHSQNTFFLSIWHLINIVMSKEGVKLFELFHMNSLRNHLISRF